MNPSRASAKRQFVRYFDHNATHPLSDTARRVWLDSIDRYPANPSSPHRLGQRAEKALDDARERLAVLLGCAAEEIVFTSGATESAHAALAGGGPVLASAIEHPCVREAAGLGATWIPVSSSGVVCLEMISATLVHTPPRLIAVMAANNETGVLQPWAKIAALCRERGVPYFCDAAQWLGKLPARGLGQCDLVSGCGHKFGGPVGVGFLKCPVRFTPWLRGGPQEGGRRAGTENVPGILAMVAGLEERERQMADLAERSAWRTAFEQQLIAAVPGLRILGVEVDRLWNTVSVLMPESADCRRRWVVLMDKLGFAVSTGSACASGKEKPSHVLTAMGIAPGEAGRALRFSAGWTTTEEDWSHLRDGVLAAVREAGLPVTASAAHS